MRSILICLFLSVFLFVGCSKKDQAQIPKRNVLLITLDTTRADRLGCYGYASAQTPNLDSLARSGVHFNSAITHVPLTRPSHASILTGTLPYHHGIWNNGPFRLEPKSVTLAESFKGAGYKTGAVISSNVLFHSFGFAQGFDFFDDSLQDTPGGESEKVASDVVTIANRWIANEIQPPFFLWLHFYDPHFPFTPPEPFRSRFANSLYDGEIAYMDDAIGKIINKLNTLGWMKNTLIVVVGDHGEGLGEHQEPSHGYLIYDSTMRVPLIMSGPGVPQNKTIDSQVSVSDLDPTILEACAIKNESKVDGKSFWKYFQSGTIPPSPSLLENRTLHYQFGWATLSGIRFKDWKWIHASTPELYDLKTDPHEKNNLALKEKKRADEMNNIWNRIRPKDTVSVEAPDLSPEEIEKLESLGYIATGPGGGGGSVEEGPDPKLYVDLLAPIEQLIHARADKKEDLIEPLTEKILAKDSKNWYALRVKAELLLKKKRFEEARELLLSLVNVSEIHPENYANLAMACEATGRLDEAILWYKKATTPPWLHWPALESLARVSVQYPDKLPPAELAAKFQKLAGESFRKRISLARALAILSSWKGARFWYEQALQSKPGSDEALVGMAQMNQNLGKKDEALKLLGKVQPPTAESLFVSGTLLSEQGQKESACTRFVEAIKKEPRNVNLLFGLGYHLSLCEEVDLAITAYRKVLERDPVHPDSLYNLAQLEEEKQNFALARDLYKKFVKVAPSRLEQQKRAAEERIREM
jgi:arylsulfatase A-like enzyme/tetratricopeptide (TPR) repeat protein